MPFSIRTAALMLRKQARRTSWIIGLSALVGEALLYYGVTSGGAGIRRKEADLWTLKLMYMAGYNLKDAATFWEKHVAIYDEASRYVHPPAIPHYLKTLASSLGHL